MQQAANDVFHRSPYFTGHQLVLGLTRKLWLWHLHAQDAAQAFTHVVACDFHFCFFCQLTVVNVLIDDPGHRGAQTCQMGATVTLRNIVGKTKHLLVVTTVPLHCDLNANIGALVALAIAHSSKNVGVQHGFTFVDEANEALDTISASKIILLAGTFVFKPDLDAIVQKAKFAQALA